MKEETVTLILSYTDAFEVLMALSTVRNDYGYSQFYIKYLDSLRRKIAEQMVETMDEDDVYQTDLLIKIRKIIDP